MCLLSVQWKVRRALAFSMHEVAAIVGEEVTRKQLVPIFNNFLKDLDEVRIGVLKHLADFLQVFLAIGVNYLLKNLGYFGCCLIKNLDKETCLVVYYWQCFLIE